MITGLISILYLVVCFYYLINSHKICLGVKYGYPKQIKKLLKIFLIFDIILQLFYQIPYISSEDDIFRKIFNTLGFSKLLNYSDESEVKYETANILEIIGKPLIYLIISLQTIRYNSIEFKKYYIYYLLTLKDKVTRNGIINSYFFNNKRLKEFKKSIDLRLENEIEMDKLKDILKFWNEKFKQEEDNLFEGPKEEPLQYIENKVKKEEEEEKKKAKIKIKKIKN